MAMVLEQELKATVDRHRLKNNRQLSTCKTAEHRLLEDIDSLVHKDQQTKESSRVMFHLNSKHHRVATSEEASNHNNRVILLSSNHTLNSSLSIYCSSSNQHLTTDSASE